MKYFAINQNSCIFVHQIRQIKNKKQRVMKTLKEANKEAKQQANKINGFVIDNRVLNTLFVKVESNYSDEYITKAEIKYKLSAEEKEDKLS